MYHHIKPQLLLLVVGLFIINFVQLPGIVQAATLSVNVIGITTDTVDGDGNCSLIDAIQEANNPGTESTDCGLGDAGADTIILSGNITLNGNSLFSGSGNNGLPSITSNITIDGNGFTIARSDAICPGGTDYRFFSVTSGGNLTLDNTTLRNGCIQGNNGGAILNAGTLVLINSTLDNNATSGMGGAIYNTGSASILNSTLNNNVADSNGGAIASTNNLDIINSTINNNNTLTTNTANGGGIFISGGTTNISHSAVRFNSTNNDGGGIYNLNGNLNILSSTISDNSAFALEDQRGGGGLYTDGGYSEIYNSIFDNNYARRKGGALFTTNFGVVDVYNSQLTNNLAFNADGGASYNIYQSRLNIYYSTISGNEAGDDGGGLRTTDSDVIIEKSLIMNNIAAESGGGIRNDGRLAIIDSTLYGNRASIYGGGILNQGKPSVASNPWQWNVTTIRNSTITQNHTAGGGGGVVNRYLGGVLNISNSIVASNTSGWGSPNCLQDVRTDSNGTGVWNTIGVGYEDNWSLKCPGFTWTTATNLGSLANNGGATQTISIDTSSIAHDASGTDATTTDQRDVTAVSTRDAGSFETDSILPILSFVTANSTGEEGTSHTVNVVLDNTSGNLSGQSLTVYLKVTGTAVGSSIDYNQTTSVPITFSGSNWPAPGTTSTLPINFDLITDNEVDLGETIVLEIAQASVAGPAFVGSTNTHTVTIGEAVTQIDLSLAKSVAVAPGGDVDGDGILEPGDTVRYSIALTNLGPSDATDITIEDVLPAGLDSASASVTSSIGTYNVANGEWSADGAGVGNGFNLNAGNNATLTIDVVISAGTTGSLITNTVSVSTTYPPAEGDIDTSNNTADASFTVSSTSADLSVSNQIDFAPGGDLDGDGVFDPGETVRYTVTLTNQGTHDTDGVVIDVALSALLDATTINAIASVGTYNAATGEWSADGAGAGNGFFIASGVIQTLTIKAVILPNTNGQLVTNAAGVSTTFVPIEPDPDITNNAMSNQFTIASSTRAQSKNSRNDDAVALLINNPEIGIFDPAISKLGILLPGQVGLKGEKLEWIVTVRNPSTVTGTNVDVVDTLIPALRIDNVVINSGIATSSVNGQTVTVNIPSLPPGGVVQFSIFTTVLESDAVVENTACVTGSNGPVCVSATAVSILPLTGETPLWRTLLIHVAIAVGLVFIITSAVMFRRVR